MKNGVRTCATCNSWQLRKLRAREIETTPLPPSSLPEPVDPPHLPPALQQLRLLEVGARNMILY